MLNFNWSGTAGGTFLFEAFPLHESNWNDVPGIYIFARHGHGQSGQIFATPLYIGQAASLRDRLGNHERYADAVRQGMTHVHAMRLQHQSDRDLVEADLIARWQPTMNTQLKQRSMADVFYGRR